MNIVVFTASEADSRQLAESLRVRGHRITHCATVEEATEAVASGPPSVAILGGFARDQMAAYAPLLRAGAGAQVTVLVGAPAGQPQLEALAAGADDVFDEASLESLAVRLAVIAPRSSSSGTAPADVLVANATDAIYTLTLDGHFTSANPAAEQLTGYPHAQLMGMHMSRLVVPEHLDSVVAEIRAKVEGERESTFLAIDIIRADGERVPIEITSRLLVHDGVLAGIQGLARDLRPRRQLERDVAFRAQLLDNVEAATYAGDLAGRVIYWNAAATKLFGYTAAEALGANVGSLIVPRGEGARVDRNVAELRAGRKVVGEYTLKRKDNSTFPAHVTNAPVFHADGSVGAIVAICIDLTERRAQEDRLARMAAIIESSNDAVIEHDLDGRIVGWNDAAERLYGYSAAEVLGKHLTFLAPEDQHAGIERARRRVMAGHRLTGRPTQRLRRDGSTAEFSISYFPVNGPDGRVSGTASIARDITEQARADQERRRLAAIIDSATDAVLGRDNQRRIASWNAAAERLFGWSAEEIVGGFAWEIVPDDLREETSAMAARLRDGLSVTAETERIDRAGRRFPVELNGFPVFDQAGAIVGSATFIRDISEKRAAERALAETEARYRAAADASRDAFFILRAERDTGGTITDFVVTELNRAAEGLITIPRERAIGGRLCELWPLNRTGGFFDRYVRVVETGEPIDEEFCIESPEINWLHNTIVRLGDGITITSRAITARKVAEAERQRLDANYRAIVDGTSDGLFVLDVEGEGDDRTFRIALINKSFSKITGLDFDGTPGKRVDEVFRGPVLANALERYRAAIASGGTISFEEPLPARKPRWVSITMTALFDETGRCYRIVGSGRDITERRQAQETVERLASIIESASEAVVSVDTRGRIVYWNAAAERIYGYAAAEVTGRHFKMLIPDDDAAQSLANWDRVLHDESPTQRHVRRLHKDGHIIDLQVSLFPLRDFDGNVIGTASVGTDISDKLRYERELLERAADLDAVFASSSEGIILAGPDLHILSFNDAARRLIQRLHGGEMQVGDHALAWVSESEHPGFVRNFQMALGGRSFTFVREVEPPDGPLWWEFSFAPVRLADGTVRGVALGIRDITQRKRTDEALLQAQKAESLAVLAGGIAHDFNNLLVGILGNAGLALTELSPTSPARPTIEAIETAGQRAAELARQMLAYSGRGRFVVQKVDLNSLVEEMAHLLRVSIGKGVRLNYQFERDLPPVEGDATQLRQVVMNLVVNASDAIGDAEGGVSITTRTIEATRELLAGAYLAPSLKPGPYVALEVADTGAGMDAETLSRIFDPFFTTKFTGRGLGLAAVLGIMRGHRGAIKVESEPGRGTTFRLLLPAARADETTSPVTAPEAAWRGSGTVLVVDDEPTVRAVTARALRSFGFDVLEAADGLEAVDLFAADPGRIVCVLLDMTMPRMGGEGAFHAIRQIDPNARVLLMSGFTEQDSTERFAGLGLAGFIQKPYGLSGLRSAIQAALAGSG